MALFLVVGCSTKKVMEDNDAQFKDINEEFGNVVKVDTIAPAAKPVIIPSPIVKDSVAKPEAKSEVKSVEKKTLTGKLVPTQVEIDAEKLRKTQEMARVKKAPARQPPGEDPEGFWGRRPLVDPFREGEEIVLAATYMNMEAGDLTIRVNPFKMVNNRRAYHFTMAAKSSKMFSLVYAIDNLAETFVDYDDLVPLTYSMEAKESSRRKEVRAFFDWSTQSATHWEKTVKKDGREKKKKIDWNIEPFSQNIISSIYYLRNFQLTPGKKMEFRIADDGKNIVFKSEVLRKERLKTALGEFDTVVVRPTFHVDEQFKPTGENLIWLSDDDRKYILRIESKIKIGSIVAKVKRITPGK